MRKNIFFAILLIISAATSHATVLSFPDQTTFNSEFPSATRYTVGSSSTVSVTANSTIQIYAQADASTVGRSTIYSAADNTNFDFISSSKTITFSSLTTSYLTSVGASYYAYAGIFSQNSGAVTASNDGIYFSIHGNGSDLTLIQRTDGANTTLYTWTLTAIQYYPTVNLSALSLTLTGTTWAVNGTVTDKNGVTSNITASGSLSTTVTASNWGTNFYIGMESDQTSSGATTRYTTMEAGAITVIPEPRTTALLILSLSSILLFCTKRYRRLGLQVR